MLNCTLSTYCPGVNISDTLLPCEADKNSYFFSGNTSDISFLPDNISRVCNCSQWYEDTDQVST